MKRKVVLQGNATLMVSLPSQWCKKHLVIKGDEVDVKDEGEFLVLSKHGKRPKKEIEIDARGITPRRLRTAMASAYRRGYTRVHIKIDDDISFVKLSEKVRTLLGFVISEHTDRKVVLDNALDPDFDNGHSAIRKMFHQLQYFLNDVIKNFLYGDGTHEELMELYGLIIQQRDYCQRIIHVKLFGGDTSYEYYTMVFAIEKIAGTLRDASKFSFSTVVKKSLGKDFMIQQKLINQLIEAFLANDVKRSLLLNETASRVRKNVTSNPRKPAILGSLADYTFSMSSRMVGVLV